MLAENLNAKGDLTEQVRNPRRDVVREVRADKENPNARRKVICDARVGEESAKWAVKSCTRGSH